MRDSSFDKYGGDPRDKPGGGGPRFGEGGNGESLGNAGARSITGRLDSRTGDRAGAGNRPLSRILDSDSESEAVEDFHCFGWLRGVRDFARMLQLRKRSGNILAVAYFALDRAEFDPSIGITLHLGGQRILIRGRNLNAEVRTGLRLFEGICRHRVPWIQEVEVSMQFREPASGVLVEDIEWH